MDQRTTIPTPHPVSAGAPPGPSRPPPPASDALASLPLAELMRRGDVLSPDCPAREILQHVTSRWGVLVLVALDDRTLRFSELRRKVGGVSERMLAQTLQVLERDGFVERRAYPVVPPHVEYHLTPLGREVGRHVQALADWIGGHLPEILAARGGAPASAAAAG
ncbi:winged helix-turn-helix transcriptional regulator [Paracidovorax avenae]|uniref:winged helix-turn-helix transcriptional regulator n=1 Tax=Paracidovorax avenae TaxID=80867 RepID=UPI001864D5D9|nr:helix-turn-helix domain-containing protein [Paracidovorax avenae]